MGHFLSDPLGSRDGPNGDILSVNGSNGYMVTTTISGAQSKERSLDSSGSRRAPARFSGSPLCRTGVYFVDDATNTLDLFTR